MLFSKGQIIRNIALKLQKKNTINTKHFKLLLTSFGEIKKSPREISHPAKSKSYCESSRETINFLANSDEGNPAWRTQRRVKRREGTNVITSQNESGMSAGRHKASTITSPTFPENPFFPAKHGKSHKSRAEGRHVGNEETFVKAEKKRGPFFYNRYWLRPSNSKGRSFSGNEWPPPGLKYKLYQRFHRRR